MMHQLRDETFGRHSRIGSPTILSLFYFTVEFWIGLLISAFLATLGALRSFLPKPPRDLTGDVVLVAGSSSSLGESLAQEFGRAGCSVICVDRDLHSVEGVASRISALYPRIEEIKPRHRKHDVSPGWRPRTLAHQCDLTDREDIRKTAGKIKDEVGKIDVLVGCIDPEQDIFSMANSGLMGLYWTILAFLPSMMQSGKAHVVGITPVASRGDAYFGSKVAIASLMENLGQELSNRSGQFTFLSLSPVAPRDSSTENHRKIARRVVDAVKRDQCSLSSGWFGDALYRISCFIYNGITMITGWMRAQDCEYPM